MKRSLSATRILLATLAMPVFAVVACGGTSDTVVDSTSTTASCFACLLVPPTLRGGDSSDDAEHAHGPGPACPWIGPESMDHG